MVSPEYIRGDFWRICDVCGFQCRASQTSKRWDGLMVCEADFETRHPQDFVRGRLDRQNVPNARPEAVPIMIGPLTTTTLEAAAAGATALNLTSTVRFAHADRIGILLSDGNEFRTTVQTVVDVTILSIVDGLAGEVSAGASVINYSAVSEPDIG
jgi:hypothetical protein